MTLPHHKQTKMCCNLPQVLPRVRSHVPGVPACGADALPPLQAIPCCPSGTTSRPPCLPRCPHQRRGVTTDHENDLCQTHGMCLITWTFLKPNPLSHQHSPVTTVLILHLPSFPASHQTTLSAATDGSIEDPSTASPLPLPGIDYLFVL